MLFLGVDPDTRHSGFAVRDESGKVVLATVTYNSSKDVTGYNAALEQCKVIDDFFYENHDLLKDVNAAAIENPVVFPWLTDPDRIIIVAFVAGHIHAKLANLGVSTQLFNVVEWKGSVPKRIAQRRILDRYGIEYVMEETSNFKSPKALPRVTEGVIGEIEHREQSHVIDALGLAEMASGNSFLKPEEKTTPEEMFARRQRTFRRKSFGRPRRIQ